MAYRLHCTLVLIQKQKEGRRTKMLLKRVLQIGLILAGALTMPAWAIMIDDSLAGVLNGTNVGSLDSFSQEDEKQGSWQSEENWVNNFLGAGSVTYTDKTPNVTYFNTDAIGVYAFSLVSAPEYFLLKNATRIALFLNNADSDWGVFDAASLSGTMNIPGDGFTISHVTEFNGDPTKVPEPGILGLLGIGLIGIVLGRRRMTA
jgi:hypothetical protein